MTFETQIQEQRRIIGTIQAKIADGTATEEDHERMERAEKRLEQLLELSKR